MTDHSAQLAGKRMLVTGAARGMGAEIAVEAARRGAEHVALADINGDGARAVAEHVRAAGAVAQVIEMDLRIPAQIASMIDDVVAAAGGLDTLVNNAGVLDHAYTPADKVLAHQLDEDVWDTVMNVNLKAVWLATKLAAPHLLASDRGPSVINAASVAGMYGARMTAYSVSKAGVIQLTRVSAISLAPKVRVNSFSPGSFRTPMSEAHLASALDRAAQARTMYGMHLLPRFGEVSEIADAVCFLASEEASFITGVNLPVDGGATAWRGLNDIPEME